MISNNSSTQPKYPTSSLNINLIQVLNLLTQRLSQTSYPTSTHQQILIKLLCRIDRSYFQYKFNIQQNFDYQSILKSLVDYYNDRKYQRIRKIFIMQLNYVHKFEHIFRLVLDLAMNYNEYQKQRYIQQIINMSERQKQILMPFVDQVMKRKFVTSIQQYKKYTDTSQIQHTQQDQYLQTKDIQYQQLRQNYQQLSQAYSQLLQNHNSIKYSYQKLLQQNTQIIQQKYQLMNQLGVHTSANFIEIAQKYKKDIKQFVRQFQRLNKQLQDKNNRIKNKQIEIKRLSGLEGSLGIWQQQKNILSQKYRKIQAQLKVVQKKQQKLRDQLQNTKITVTKLREEVALKDQQIINLNKIKQRHKSIKQYHYVFKKKFNQKMREI